MEKVDLNKYKDFVEKVTSIQSNETGSLTEQLHRLEADSDVNMSLLLTGGIGLSSETGEFNEIIKKCIFQGKPLNDETVYHLKRELGDIMWYWVTACAALKLDPFDVISENQQKLEARYGEKFAVQRSEIRKEGDL